jgi:branched-chain amino acid transport system permease protein
LLVAVGVLSGFRHLQLSLTEMLLRMTIVVGLYVFIGNSGILSFGHIGFVCIGAYAAGWATADPDWKQLMLTGLPSFLQDEQYPFLVAQAGAMLLPAVVALALGAAIMRLRGIAASISTFAFLIMVQSFYSNWDSVTAGASSLARLPTIVDPWIGLVFAFGAIAVAHLFQISRWGLMLRASRDDDVAAKASGVRIVRERLIAFVLSAAIVGAGGGLYAEFLGSMTVDEFYLEMTFVTLAMLVVGGIGSLSGAIVGVVVVTFVVEFLRTLEHGVSLGPTTFALPSGSQEIGLGVVMALILILRPTGLTRSRELMEWRGDSAISQQSPAGRSGRTVEVSGVTQFEHHNSKPKKDMSVPM